MKNMKALIVIVNAGFGNEVIDITRECKAGGATIINGRGTGAQNKSFLGIKVEPEKEIIVSLVEEEVGKKIMAEVYNRSGLQSPASGISFLLPVDSVTKLDKLIELNNKGY